MTSYAYAMLEVGGIQKYILSTGKLKEMIGGSELIESLGECCTKICNQLGLQEKDIPDATTKNWYVSVQKAAGTLRLILPDRDCAKRFLAGMSRAMLESCPGLPLYSTCVDCKWTPEGLQNAASDAKDAIERKRGQAAMAPKSLWPFCRCAPLDGLPAVALEKREYLSALSVARRAPLNKASKRLEKIGEELLEHVRHGLSRLSGKDTVLRWVTDIDALLEGAPVQRIALIHIDGNDLGKAFRTCLSSNSGKSPEAQLQKTNELSALVESCSRKAFAEGLKAAVDRDPMLIKVSGEYIVPARPLVLGGDDVTLVIRADLAFHFVNAFATAFEKLSEEKGRKLSVGAGMAIIPGGYPFLRAFHLAEQLTESAKKMTMNETNRPSSVDYLILTNDVETDLSALRTHIATAKDGLKLTGKPFLCGNARKSMFHLEQFLENAGQVLNKLPASGLRSAINGCREGKAEGQRAWEKLCENLKRGLGGRHSQRLIETGSFERLFPNGFFIDKKPFPEKDSEQQCTLLGDYLELRNLNLFASTER